MGALLFYLFNYIDKEYFLNKWECKKKFKEGLRNSIQGYLTNGDLFKDINKLHSNWYFSVYWRKFIKTIDSQTSRTTTIVRNHWKNTTWHTNCFLLVLNKWYFFDIRYNIWMNFILLPLSLENWFRQSTHDALVDGNGIEYRTVI